MMSEDISDTEGTHHKNPTRKTQLATGYESDSDDQGFGADSDDSDDSGDEGDEEKKQDDGANNKSETEIAEAEEDDDMFASDNEENEPPAGSKNNKKPKNTLDIDEFEKEQGLEDYHFDEKLDRYGAGNDVSNGSDDGPQEVKLEAFNLREEVESGKFDKDMNYIRQENNDSEEEEEPWMAEASAEDIRKAKEAQQKQEKSKEDNAILSRPVSEILQGLIQELEPAETPMEAFSRLRPEKKRRDKNQARTDDTDRKQTVYRITEFCEQLVNEKGIVSAYDMSREELMRAFKNETGEDFQPTRGVKRNAEEMEPGTNEYGDAIWEFRWIDESEVNGPYSTYEMKYWKESYFENNVEVRKLNEPTFRHVSDVSFEEN